MYDLFYLINFFIDFIDTLPRIVFNLMKSEKKRMREKVFERKSIVREEEILTYDWERLNTLRTQLQMKETRPNLSYLSNLVK